MTTTHRQAGAVATYVLVSLIALLIGAAAMWTYEGDKPVSGVPAVGKDSVTTHGEWVSIKRGRDSIRAYVAYPERKTKAPAIIVIHEIFGLSDWEQTVADRLAKEGYVAILPDLLSSKHGVTPADPDSGRKLVGQLEPERVTADLNAVYTYVNGLPAVASDQVGTIGFCWGGGQSFRYATNNPNLRAAVVCYGPPPDSAAIKRIKAPVLGIYGENDARIDATLPGVVAEMQSAGKTFTHEVYPGTGHGFLKPGRQGSDGPQVDKAWGDILDFFKQKLDTKNVNGKQ
jgi:carboxymethylenebutenolidase